MTPFQPGDCRQCTGAPIERSQVQCEPENRGRFRADQIGYLASVVSQVQGIARQFESGLHEEESGAIQRDKALLQSVCRMMIAGHNGDFETGSHLVRVSYASRALALAIGLVPESALEIAAAAPMHDLGKTRIPRRILCKPGPLSAEERDIVETHAAIGAELLSGAASPMLRTARDIAFAHHERWDGTGYPRRLRGRDIPVAARLVMMADQYDALRSRRPYKPPFDHDRVCCVLLKGDGRTMPSHFDPDLLAAFRQVEKELERLYDEATDLGSLADALHDVEGAMATGSSEACELAPGRETAAQRL